MRMNGRWTAVLAALAVSVASFTSHGAVISYNSGSSASSRDSGKTSDATSGPGVRVTVDEEEESTEFSGPTVEKVTLGENYHEEYQVYEESIEDMFFIYSNIGNGDITHEAVVIDIPHNVLYSMEKDGLPREYVSGQRISEKGTYVLNLIAVENPELPLSEQTEYQAVFRFRIQDAPPVEETESQQSGSGASLWGGTSAIESSGEIISIGPGNMEAETEEAPEEDEDDPDGDSQADAEEDEDDLDGDSQADAEGDGESGEPVQSDMAVGTGIRTQAYDPMQGKYIVTLENGIQLISTVPEGYIGPEAVQLTLPEEAATRTELYLDDVPVEFVSGNSQMEEGSYRMVLDGCSYSFTIASRTSSIDYYPAPVGMRFTEVRLDDEPLSLASGQSLSMREDGIYTILMEGTEGDRLDVTLIKDTEAPRVQVTVNGGTAAIAYVSEDIAAITLEKDGAVVEGFSGNSISSPGRYRLAAADEAGNESVQEFVLNYQINAYGVVAVLLCILVIAGMAVFVVHTKKNMKIR